MDRHLFKEFGAIPFYGVMPILSAFIAGERMPSAGGKVLHGQFGGQRAR
jgi:hypothetical protein